MDNDDYDSLPTQWPIKTHMLAGAAAGIIEHTIMYPVDCVKTRMQSIHSVRYQSVLHAFTTIQKTEGLRRLFRGMGAMVTGAGPAHAMYFAGYERLKYNFTLFANDGIKNSSLANGIAGSFATILHDIVMNPAEVVKQRMQMYGSRHGSMFQCILTTLKSEGILAFYRSFPTQLIMNVPFQAVHFVVYEWTQERFNPERSYNPLSHVASGAIAGACASFVTNPLDVCRTLLNTQELLEGNVQVSGLRQAAITIYRTDGYKTFFRGVTPRVLYQMPSTAIAWSVYELFKYLLRSGNNKVRCRESSNTTQQCDITFQNTPVCAAPTREPAITSTVSCKDI